MSAVRDGMQTRILFEFTHEPYNVDTGFMGVEAPVFGPTHIIADTVELAQCAFRLLHPQIAVLSTRKLCVIDAIVSIQ